MELKSGLTKLISMLGKYKYVALVLIIGIVLMLLPGTAEPSETEVQEPLAVSEETSVEEALSKLLSQIEGAGKVEVMLSCVSGAETVYQTNTDRSESGDSTSEKSDTVTITDADRNESGLIRQVNPPVYAGAVVVCQGADRAAVRLAIVEAVSKFTGLGADQIAVLKMK